MADDDLSAPAEVTAPSEPAPSEPAAPVPTPATAPAADPAAAAVAPTPSGPVAHVAAAAAAPAEAPPAPVDACLPGACIDNGTILLGVNPTGELNISNGAGSASGDRSDVGLHYLPTGNDGTVAGGRYEGWGVADRESGVWGGANRDELGPAGRNIAVTSFTSSDSTATSVVTVGDPTAPTFEVTHAFSPSAKTPNLYVVKVTIKNLTDRTIEQVLYRRVMDFDVEPTPYNELVTIATGDAEAILDANDNGFGTVNPLVDTSPIVSGAEGDFEDSGPFDHGALFDFGLGSLAPGELLEFLIYYGAAASEDEAKEALAAVGAEAFALGKTTDGVASGGAPNTFIFGFSGIDGTPVFPDPDPDPEPEPVGPTPVDPEMDTPDPVEGSNDDGAVADGATDQATDVTPASATTTTTMAAAPVQTSAQLPATGASLSTDLAPVGLLLLALGGAFVIIGRRRGGLAA